MRTESVLKLPRGTRRFFSAALRDSVS